MQRQTFFIIYKKYIPLYIIFIYIFPKGILTFYLHKLSFLMLSLRELCRRKVSPSVISTSGFRFRIRVLRECFGCSKIYVKRQEFRITCVALYLALLSDAKRLSTLSLVRSFFQRLFSSRRIKI